MNKEECLKALETLQDKYLNFDVVDELICFKSLIEEHFDNPPLKFEELEAGMWVWDNREKEYIKAHPGTNIEGNRCVIFEYSRNQENEYDEYFVLFEENRFYRKQV